jgi:hypothetical protein
MDLSPELSNTLWFLMVLIGLGVALTFYVFHWRKFDEGYEKGDAVDPETVARDNPPDEWAKSHWKATTK